MFSIIALSALKDNYIWVIKHNNLPECVIVDPGASQPVIDYLTRNNYKLSAILITHHHADHTDGIAELYKRYQPRVYGPATISAITHPVAGGDYINLWPRIMLQVTATPGHTCDHIIYHNDMHLFCGDTLFACGCGRAFEHEPVVLYNSLQKILTLFTDCYIYPAHEYTIDNCKFALWLEQDNPQLLSYYHKAQARLTKGLASVPTLLSVERLVNPFLRTDDLKLQQKINGKLGCNLSLPHEFFIALRNYKDHFKAI